MTAFSTPRARLAALTASVALLGYVPAAHANPRTWPLPPAPGPSTVYDAPWTGAAPRSTGDEAQSARRCNVGRLVGGLFGGAVGYGAARGDGRTWAVPLGTLLGQQMGCNLANSRLPLPW